MLKLRAAPHYLIIRPDGYEFIGVKRLNQRVEPKLRLRAIDARSCMRLPVTERLSNCALYCDENGPTGSLPFNLYACPFVRSDSLAVMMRETHGPWGTMILCGNTEDPKQPLSLDRLAYVIGTYEEQAPRNKTLCSQALEEAWLVWDQMVIRW